ncbi:MAG: ABC transporter substrate-binding protein [Deltaproteobacteria bacterium]|nr:ABC transporter substrate-binding protein [Deltaproteobacteria bacterium]
MRPGMIAAMIMTRTKAGPLACRRRLRALGRLRRSGPLTLLVMLLCAASGSGPARAADESTRATGREASPEIAPAPASHAAAPPRPADPALRLVSLNPSLTAIVVRLGAADQLVGIDDYSARMVPELADRPRVGGLFDPSLEAVMALAPDRVLLVAGLEQEAHGAALRRLGLAVEVFENERYEQVLGNIARLGRLVGREAEAADRIAAIRALRAAVERAVRGRTAPRTLIVIDRSPLYLVGGGTFLDELLHAVGAANLGAGVAQGYPRGSLEWLVAAAPELVLDLSPQSEAPPSEAPQTKARANGSEPSDALAFWSRWPSLPAVKTGRVLALDATRISLPGPELDRALRELAVAVHGPDIEPAIERELAKRGTP